MNYYLKLSITAILACIFAACSKQGGTQTQEKIIPVKVMEVAATQTAGGRNYIGTVEESVAVSLSFPNMGTVEEVFVQEGQRVRKGQLLAALNTATVNNSYQASLASLRQAQDAYDRLVEVHENGSLSDIKLVEVETGLEQAKSMAAIMKKSLDDCKLYAPRDGVVATRSVEAGTSVMPGVTAFRLVSVDKVNVKISVSENEISSVSEGQKASIEVPALDNAVFEGKIELKGVAANVISRSYEAKIGVDNPQSRLMPGMVCKVYLENVGNTAEKIVVPNRAVQISADRRQYVWLAENNTAKRRFIKTGSLTDYGIIVAEGLSEGDTLIIEGYRKIGEGMKISINTSAD